MKKTFRILAGLTALALVGMIIYRKRSRDIGDMLKNVSDEGYETAHDVLYPTREQRRNDLRYGPVIPR
ncbi:MAG: hypothetical protein ABIT58_10355 [Ferruginibacter sp.]